MGAAGGWAGMQQRARVQPSAAVPAFPLHFHKLPTLKSDLQARVAGAGCVRVRSDSTGLCPLPHWAGPPTWSHVASSPAPHPHTSNLRDKQGRHHKLSMSAQAGTPGLPGHLHALVQLVNHAHQLVRRAHKALGVLPRAVLCRRGQGRQPGADSDAGANLCTGLLMTRNSRLTPSAAPSPSPSAHASPSDS